MIQQQRGYWGLAFVLISSSLLAVMAYLSSDTMQHRQKSGKKFGQIARALQQYHERFDAFPPAYVSGPDGLPWHSWRVLILPYLGQNEVYEKYRFDEPWNSEANLRIANEERNPFSIPVENMIHSRAQYIAVVGEQTMWLNTESIRKSNIQNPLNEVVQLAESYNSDILWTEPRDINFGDAKKWPADVRLPGISGQVGPPYFAFADGSVDVLYLRNMKKPFEKYLLVK
ncbi:MAG: DUF1559 domain-containing protein [Planctomycetota bacterium]|nr:DUF1559 domain-containing protein [Planctomycetota bacterium]MDA1211504.1 DUF1559 domain-containing protein [Planctomycetota bacterium]